VNVCAGGVVSSRNGMINGGNNHVGTPEKRCNGNLKICLMKTGSIFSNNARLQAKLMRRPTGC
jgi:hypothetical protein